MQNASIDRYCSVRDASPVASAFAGSLPFCKNARHMRRNGRGICVNFQKENFKNLLHFKEKYAIIYRLLYPMSKNMGNFRVRGKWKWRTESIPSTLSASSSALAARLSSLVLPRVARCVLKFAPSATPSTPASRNLSMQAVVWTSSRRDWLLSESNSSWSRRDLRARFERRSFGAVPPGHYVNR